MSQDWKNYVESIYYNPKHPASYSGLEKLYKVIKQEGKFTISRKQLRQWLKSQETYTLHRSVRHNFPRSRVMVTSKDQQWDADLADMQALSKSNKGVRYILVMIDILSRFVWTYPLKSKTGGEVVKAMQAIFAQGRKPKSIRTDKGTEFTNAAVQKYLKGLGVNHFVTQNEKKSNFSERMIRTLKGKLYRYMTQNQTHKYIDVLQDMTNSYNHTTHRSLKRSPAQASKEKDIILWSQQYTVGKRKKKRKFQHNTGDWVRLSHLRQPFDRDFHQKWTNELFKITTRKMRQGQPIYTVTDYAGDDVTGTFYEPEVQSVLVEENALYKIDKILKKRKRQGKTEYLVHWLGWPKKYDSWVTSADIESIKDTAPTSL